MIQSKVYVSTPSHFLGLRGKYDESPEVWVKDNGQSEGEDIWGGAKSKFTVVEYQKHRVYSLLFCIIIYKLLYIFHLNNCQPTFAPPCGRKAFPRQQQFHVLRQRVQKLHGVIGTLPKLQHDCSAPIFAHISEDTISLMCWDKLWTIYLLWENAWAAICLIYHSEVKNLSQ